MPGQHTLLLLCKQLVSLSLVLLLLLLAQGGGSCGCHGIQSHQRKCCSDVNVRNSGLLVLEMFVGLRVHASQEIRSNW